METNDINEKNDIAEENVGDIVPETEEETNSECGQQFQYHLFINLKGGQHLAAKDSSGTSDPYVKFLLKDKCVHKSGTVHKSLNPTWDESFMVTVGHLKDPFKLKVYDYNLAFRDEFMGETSMVLESLEQNKSLDLILPLTNEKYGGEDGVGQLLVGVNLVAVPLDLVQSSTSPSYQTFPKPTSPMSLKRQQARPAVLSLVLVRGNNLAGELYCKFRLGEETWRSKSVSDNSGVVTWMDQTDLPIPDQANLPDLEVKLKDQRLKDSLVGRCSVTLSSLDREVSHQLEVSLQDKQERLTGQLLLLVTLTGLAQQDRPTRSAPNRGGALRDLGWLEVKIHQAEGLATTKLGGSSDPFCVLELDNTLLQTSVEPRTVSPTWGKPTFRLPVRDLHSALYLSMLDKGPGAPSLLGRLCLPLLSLPTGPSWCLLKDKRLRGPARGNMARVLLECRLNCDLVKAVAVTLNPKEEIFLPRSDKFKRRVLNNNIARIKVVVKHAVDFGLLLRSQMHWESRVWTLTAFFLFALVTLLLEPYMLPLALSLAIARNLLATHLEKKEPRTETSAVTIPETTEKEENEAEKDENVSFKDVMQTVQDAFPLVQNVLGEVASLVERVQNTLACSVPLLSLLATILLLLISILLLLLPLRAIILLAGSVKFIRNLIRPGAATNNELMDFLSRVPDHEMLEDARLLPFNQETNLAEKKIK